MTGDLWKLRCRNKSVSVFERPFLLVKEEGSQQLLCQVKPVLVKCCELVQLLQYCENSLLGSKRSIFGIQVRIDSFMKDYVIKLQAKIDQ